ncbi:unnamed protein product [Spirodela intermedia]|uniref:Large ribosomal subunit protein bL28m n=1 Tax=Spirodela intermedia TaxID=51605 RepID=A0A7I8LDJ5_SPIIN|nr:unnamed protein product [Spirodela intermedia]
MRRDLMGPVNVDGSHQSGFEVARLIVNPTQNGLIRAQNRESILGRVGTAGETRRTWKPNVQEKRLFSYALDRHIRVKVTTHALRCIDKAGGIDEYLLKTPYQRMDTEMGLLWKAKIEKLYQELGQAEAFFFSPEEEARIEAGFEEYRAARRAAKKSSSQDPAAEGGAS